MKEITIAQNADIHRQTAAEIFGFDPGAVISSQRVAARAINFGLIYGNKDPESMIARYRAMDSDMPALRTAHAAYQRFSETADDPDPMIQFERRMLRQQRVDLVRLSVRSSVIAAALAGFEDAGVRAKYTQVAKHMVQDGE